MPKQEKIEKVESLKKDLQEYKGYVFTDYRGLNVKQINELRNELRSHGAEFHVVKNRFVKRVLHDLGYEGLDDFLINPTALAYFNTDITDVVKVIYKYADETSLAVKGGYVGENIYSSGDLEVISKLPSRELLITQTISLINSPISGLVWTLNGLLSGFVRTIKAIEQKKQQEA